MSFSWTCREAYEKNLEDGVIVKCQRIIYEALG